MEARALFLSAAFAAAALASGAADFDVRSFGASGDGKTKDTVAIQSAIDACADAGGGRVVLEGGTFLTGAIALKSGVDLHIDRTAKLLASPDIADFPDWPDAKHVVRENLPRTRSACVVFADEAERIAITGGGSIDANGTFHVREKTDPDWKVWRYERVHPMEKSLPRVVFFAGCRDVLVEGVTLENLPAGWGFWIHDCDRVRFSRVNVVSDVRYPNNDGIHVNCSRDVAISDCFVETGDDSIVVRANSRSLRENRPCERVVVQNCVLRSWANGIRVGWVNDGAIRDCLFSNIVMRDTSCGIAIVLPKIPSNPDYGREATLVEGLSFDSIRMDGIYAHPVHIEVSPLPETRVEAIRNIRFSNIHARGLQYPHLCGRPGTPFEDVVFSNCTFEKTSDAELPGWERHGRAWGRRHADEKLAYADGVTFDNVRFRDLRK